MNKSPESSKTKIKSRMSVPNSVLAEEWKKNPLVNPITKRTIKVNGKTYLQLVKDFGFDPMKTSTRSPRSKSPVRSPRSKSPVRSPRSKSPVRSPRSKSPVRSPVRSPRSKSPVRSPRSKSPVRSPVRSPRSKSPVRSPRSKSPVRSPRSKSPVRSPRSKSPVRSPRSKSPIRSPRSKSPVSRRFTKEDCEEWNKNKEVNPKTNRKIKINGPVYKTIEEQCADTPAVTTKVTSTLISTVTPKGAEYTAEECKAWKLNPEINPKTNRKIKKNGPVYNTIYRACKIYNDVSTTSVSKKKDEEEKSKEEEMPKIISLNNKDFLESQHSQNRFEVFEELARSKGFTVTNVPMDGNCMLSTVGSYFNLTAADMRKYLLDYINRCNIEDETFKFDKSFRDKLQKEGEWCDEETIQLIKIALKAKIIILNELTNSLIEISDENSENEIFLGYLNDLHYVIITPIGQSQKVYTLPSVVECKKVKITKKILEEPEESKRVNLDEIKSLVEQINEIKGQSKISTFMETEFSLLKTIGIM